MTVQLAESRLRQALCLAMYSATNATVQLYRDLLAPWGLTYQQMTVLAVLWEEGTVTPGRIAEVTLLDSSSVTGLLNRLQRSGLVERETDPSDRRRVCVSPTARGLELRCELGWVAECMARAIDLSPGEARDLTDRLHGLRERVVSFPRPPAPAVVGGQRENPLQS